MSRNRYSRSPGDPSPYGELDDYLRPSKKERFLTREEERDFVAKAQAGDETAIGRLIVTNMRFIAKIAHKASKGRNFRMPLEDACQEGVMGLMRAIVDFDLSRNLRFHTYAYQWIRNAIQRANFEYMAIRVPVYVIYSSEGVEVSEEFRQKAALALGCRAASDILAGEPGSEASMTWESLFGSKAATSEADAEEHERLDRQKEKVHDWLADLKHKESKVIRGRFGFDGEDSKTLEEVGATMGITKERVRQIEAKALGRLAKSGGD